MGTVRLLHMGLAKRVTAVVGASLAPRLTRAAPTATSQFVHTALDRAIRGAGKLSGAAAAADAALAQHDGNEDEAIRDLIEKHVRYAGGQGFLTNLGGVVAMAVAVPANIAGLALIQCRLVAAIAHLRGYDLEDPRTRDAILVALLGEERLLAQIRAKKIPGTPMAIATAPVHDPQLDVLVANEVAAELLTKVAGKRLATTVGRRIPVVGGMVGAGTDGYSTWQIGRYVDRELLRRRR